MTAEITPEMLPCPFCGGEAAMADPHGAFSRLAAAYCDTCEIKGPLAAGAVEASKAWNTRAMQSASVSDGLVEGQSSKPPVTDDALMLLDEASQYLRSIGFAGTAHSDKYGDGPNLCLDKIEDARAAIEAGQSSKLAVAIEALTDWQNCWFCPCTDFEAEVPRLLEATDKALTHIQGEGI